MYRVYMNNIQRISVKTMGITCSSNISKANVKKEHKVHILKIKQERTQSVTISLSSHGERFQRVKTKMELLQSTIKHGLDTNKYTHSHGELL